MKIANQKILFISLREPNLSKTLYNFLFQSLIKILIFYAIICNLLRKYDVCISRNPTFRQKGVGKQWKTFEEYTITEKPELSEYNKATQLAQKWVSNPSDFELYKGINVRELVKFHLIDVINSHLDSMYLIKSILIDESPREIFLLTPLYPEDVVMESYCRAHGIICHFLIPKAFSRLLISKFLYIINSKGKRYGINVKSNEKIEIEKNHYPLILFAFYSNHFRVLKHMIEELSSIKSLIILPR
ncbi:MAG: hypothetical protein ACFFDN_26085, partial [Candidatus Hodarchaeota archaeon]